ncbi:MAG: ABC transporter ATP-binding protein [Deltaproteobacteria bacterium]|nr:ABC transporter ATP-binding protein [Deltaproteobacteria bacterium]MBW2421212.1 ABC transporter ATP-binding protein [Deltaproteobacteria bacterium]
MASIQLESVGKVYPNDHVALRGLDLEVEDRELLVLVGPSGCGKSTALRLVAGLDTPSSGRILFDGHDVTSVEASERNVAMVFQSYALYPHMTVGENLGFGLRMRGCGREALRGRVEAVAQRLDLAALLERRPSQLSGGQRQRVALGRALARCLEGEGEPARPAVLLLDEPLSNLDARLRLEMRTELQRLKREIGVTMIHVTHDQEEALTLGDRIAVLRDGELQQLATPAEVHDAPATLFVADFIGSPPINWFSGEVGGDERGPCFMCDELRIALPEAGALERGRALRLGVRPHDLVLAPGAEGDLRAKVEVVESLGSTVLVHARSGSGSFVRVVVAPDAAPAIGDELSLALKRAALHCFDDATGKRVVRE